MSSRLRTTYYTRKVCTTIPGTDNLQEYNMVSYITLGNKRYVRYGHEDWGLDLVMNAEGYTKFDYGDEFYPFYIHSDHLGSASWITDDAAHPVQYIHYAPYGELIANQSLNGYDERYKFTGKERDKESGYDFFGARFYCSPLGIWTRPDPMLDKTIRISSYMYCNGNPINNIDPNGMIDGKMIGYGALNIAKGVGTVMGGTAICGATVGGASPIGAVLIFDGLCSTGLGATIMIAGFFVNPNDNNLNIPTSATNALAKSADIIMGNDNHIVEYTMEGLMIVVGQKAIVKGAEKVFTKTTTGLQVAELGINVFNEYNESISEFFSGPNSEYLNVDMENPSDNTRVFLPEKTRPMQYKGDE